MDPSIIIKAEPRSIKPNFQTPLLKETASTETAFTETITETRNKNMEEGEVLDKPDRYIKSELVTRHVSVSGFEPGTTLDEVSKLFSYYGNIDTVSIEPPLSSIGSISDKIVVNFNTIKEASDSIKALDRVQYKGGTLSVQFTEGKPTKSLWVGNVHSSVASSELETLFAKYGEIKRVNVFRRSNCAIISYTNKDDAIAAKNKLHKYQLKVWRLIINFGRDGEAGNDAKSTHRYKDTNNRDSNNNNSNSNRDSNRDSNNNNTDRRGIQKKNIAINIKNGLIFKKDVGFRTSHLYVSKLPKDVTSESIYKELDPDYRRLLNVTLYPEERAALLDFKTYADARDANSIIRKGMMGVHPNVENCSGLPSKHLWLGNLLSTVTRADIMKAFEKYGKIDDVNIHSHRRCAFVDFADIEDSLNAFNTVTSGDGIYLAGAKLMVDFGIGPRSNAQCPTKSLFIRLADQHKEITNGEMLDKTAKYNPLSVKTFNGATSYAFVHFDTIHEAIVAKSDLSNNLAGGIIETIEFSTNSHIREQDSQARLLKGGKIREEDSISRGRSTSRSKSRSKSRSPPRSRPSTRERERERETRKTSSSKSSRSEKSPIRDSSSKRSRDTSPKRSSRSPKRTKESPKEQTQPKTISTTAESASPQQTVNTPSVVQDPQPYPQLYNQFCQQIQNQLQPLAQNYVQNIIQQQFAQQLQQYHAHLNQQFQQQQLQIHQHYQQQFEQIQQTLGNRK